MDRKRRTYLTPRALRLLEKLCLNAASPPLAEAYIEFRDQLRNSRKSDALTFDWSGQLVAPDPSASGTQSTLRALADQIASHPTIMTKAKALGIVSLVKDHSTAYRLAKTFTRTLYDFRKLESTTDGQNLAGELTALADSIATDEGAMYAAKDLGIAHLVHDHSSAFRNSKVGIRTEATGSPHRS